jgi:hypothetical protein
VLIRRLSSLARTYLDSLVERNVLITVSAKLCPTRKLVCDRRGANRFWTKKTPFVATKLRRRPSCGPSRGTHGRWVRGCDASVSVISISEEAETRRLPSHHTSRYQQFDGLFLSWGQLPVPRIRILLCTLETHPNRTSNMLWNEEHRTMKFERAIGRAVTSLRSQTTPISSRKVQNGSLTRDVQYRSTTCSHR